MTSFTIRQLTPATSEAFTGVKIDGSTATEGEDYTIDGSTITLSETFTAAPTVALVNHIVFADESVEDQNLLVAFGAPNGEFFTGAVTIDGTTYTVKAPCGQIHALKVEYKDGETTVKEEHIDVTGLKVGASYTVPFRMYVEKDGALYQTTKNGSNPYYGDAVTLAFNTTVTKTVTPVDLGGGTLVLLEDLDDTDEQSAGDRASNCSAYNNKAYSSSVTLSPGIYTFIVKAQNKGRGSSVKVGDTTAFTIENVNANKGAWTDKTFTNVAIPAAGNVTLAKGGSNTIDCYDIIIAIQTGDAPVSTTATTTAAGKGWATLYTPWPLDFANATPATLKAYTATLEGTTVTLTEVPTVPAGTGVVLKSSTTDKNTEYSIPVIASSSIEKGSMMGYTSDTHLNASTAYILNINGDGKAQFFINDDGIIAARKAYLPVGTNPAKALSVVFADDMTGITNANAAEEAAQPAKRIVNGQLVIEKNGKRYNAAGAEF
ncbi:MAG: hypothetical protein IKN75_10905 [Prevotella sp.]|nr:hypothetical protein [Prevotella sp.]